MTTTTTPSRIRPRDGKSVTMFNHIGDVVDYVQFYVLIYIDLYLYKINVKPRHGHMNIILTH